MTRIRTISFILFLSVDLLLGGFQPSLAAWQEPSSTTPPAGNIPAPLSVGNNNQAKEGKLCVGGACTLGSTIKLEVKGATNVQRDLIVDKNLTVLTNSLFVDSTLHKVGVGATTGLTGELTVIAGALQGVSVTAAAGTAAVSGTSTTGTGVKGETRAPVSGTLPAGVSAKATSATPGVGVHGRTTLGFGVYGVTLAGAAVFGEAVPPSNPAAGYGVYGENLNAAGGVGVSGQGRASGVYARADCLYGSCAGYLGPEYSLVAEAPTSGNRRYGLYAEQPDVDPAFPLRYAGYFAGVVRAGTSAPNPSFGDANAIPEIIGQQFLQTGVRPSILPFSAGQIVSSTAAGTGYKMAFDGTNIWKTNAGNGLDKYRTNGTSLGSFAVAPAGQSIWGLVFDGTYIWTANNGGGAGSVSRVLASDPTQFTQFTAGFGSVTKYIAFDGKYIWVTDSQASGTLKKVDRSSGVVLQTVVLGAGLPTGITFDGTYLWVIDFAAQDVKKVRASDGSIVATVTLGGTAFYSAFDGRFLWVPIVNNKQVKKIDPSANTVVATYDLSAVSSFPRDVLFDGTYIWITDNWTTGKVIQMLAADGSIVKTISVAATPWSLVFDGTYIYVDPLNTLTKIAAGAGFGTPDLSKVVLLKPSAQQTGSINLSGNATIGGTATVGTDLAVTNNAWGGADDTTVSQLGWVPAHLAGASLVISLTRAGDGSIYASTDPNGDVFKSTDNGVTWSNTAGDLIGVTNARVVFAAREGVNDVIYAGTGGSAGNCRVYKSSDGGNSWSNTASLGFGPCDVNALFQESGGSILVGVTPSGGGAILRSTNGGMSWVLVHQSGALSYSISSFIQLSGGTILAGGYGDVYKSLDGGATWSLSGTLAGTGEIFEILASLDTSLYAATGSTGKIFRSVDGGASWTEVSSTVLLEPCGLVPLFNCNVRNVYDIIQAPDGTFTISTGQPTVSPPAAARDVWTSRNGLTWYGFGVTGVVSLFDLLPLPDGTMLAAGDTGDVFKINLSLTCPPTMLQKGVKVDASLRLIESHCRTL